MTGAAGRAAGGPPLTLGTAGHIDHGKTALIGALTGVDTDRLPEEKRRGISIALGYAALRLPSGRRLSVVDVPGHERFVRTMVAGATGIDLYLMCIAADDGVMPQTREHAEVLAALGVERGVVAITKADLIDPELAAAEAVDLLGDDVEVVACSARTGDGVAEVAAALDRVAAGLPGRAGTAEGPVLHVDRSFTVHGAGTVVTGTLWAGAIGRDDRLVLLPAGQEARVRSVHVHDEPVDRAQAGQRVAVNLVGVARDDVGRGDVLAAPGSDLRPSYVIDAALHLRDAEHGRRVHVHHGTREAPARMASLGGRFWQLRLEQPLVAAAGDRLVVRSVAPPDTLGGGVVLDPRARKHGPSRDVLARLARIERGEPEPQPAVEAVPRRQTPAAVEPQPLSAEALALEERLRAAGHEGPLLSEVDAEAFAALRAAGRAVRVGRMAYHPDAVEDVRRRVQAIVDREGCVTLPALRDDLDTTRKFAQGLLEHLDSERFTLRRPDDSRVLRRRGG